MNMSNIPSKSESWQKMDAGLLNINIAKFSLSWKFALALE